MPASPVHPHVHGERKTFHGELQAEYGSSPRTWGTRLTPSASPPPSRFIPTYMGNASPPIGAGIPGSVHPHVHGERLDPFTVAGMTAGSSPRTWGTPPTHRGARADSRFIPTYMGNARLEEMRRRRSPVHPHVHGERLNLVTPGPELGGSSPRTWGTPLVPLE